MSDKKVKICVGYHRPSYLLKGDCFVPIWGGKACYNIVSKEDKFLTDEQLEWMNQHCLGDDTGDNISNKNRNYCEATILYWMWKNYEKLGNPDYIGLLQYRRHFVLNSEYAQSNYKGNIHNLIIEEYFTQDSQYKIGLMPQYINKILDSYDGIFCVNDAKQTVQSYKANHHSQDIKYWEKTLEIIKDDWPQYYPAATKYNYGTIHAWSNCFVMKKEDFVEYCPFLFDVLAKIDSFAKDEYEKMTIEQMRVPAYISETLLGIFYIYLSNKGRKFKSVPLLYVKKPFELLEFMPQKIDTIKENAIPIVLIADETYIKYTSVTIESIIQNSSKDNFYDIIILEDGSIDENFQKRICLNCPNNVSIRFFNASYYIRKYDFKNFWVKRLQLITYLVGFIPEILENYKKALFLDSDILVLKDIANLYNVNVSDQYIAAIRDYVTTDVNMEHWDMKRDYIKTLHKMKNYKNYFNSGVILYNLNAIRSDKEFVNKFISESKFKHTNRVNLDQDSLNFILEDKVMYLPANYNFQYSLLYEYYSFLPQRIKKIIDNVSKDIFILHYDGNYKPWDMKKVDYLTDQWWMYARKTPFYEEFLEECFKNKYFLNKKIVDISFENSSELSFQQKIFSVRNSDDKKHKIITILGIKISLKKGDK